MEHNWIGVHWSVGNFWEKLLHCETSIFQQLLNAYQGWFWQWSLHSWIVLMIIVKPQIIRRANLSEKWVCGKGTNIHCVVLPNLSLAAFGSSWNIHLRGGLWMGGFHADDYLSSINQQPPPPNLSSPLRGLVAACLEACFDKRSNDCKRGGSKRCGLLLAPATWQRSGLCRKIMLCNVMTEDNVDVESHHLAAVHLSTLVWQGKSDHPSFDHLNYYQLMPTVKIKTSLIS